MSEQGECRDWEAWQNRMPGAEKSITVTSTCQFRTTGFTVELERNPGQGINPKDLMLDKVVNEPTGPVSEVITDVPAHYKEVTDMDYDTVTIQPEGPTIPVQTVQ